MAKVLFRIYAVLTAVFGIGMLFFMISGPAGMPKLFALALLWCMAGMFVNSKAFVRLVERAEKSWEKRE